MVDYKKNNERLLIDIEGYLSIKKITREVFLNDVQILNEHDFKQKYTALFDGTIRKFSSKQSFDGSFRRLKNKKYESSNIEFKQIEIEYRTKSKQIKQERQQKQKQEKQKENVPFTDKIIENVDGKEWITLKNFSEVWNDSENALYDGRAEQFVSQFKQAWQLRQLIKKGARQCVVIYITVNLYSKDIDKTGKETYTQVQKEMPMSFSSNYTVKITLINQFYSCLEKLKFWIENTPSMVIEIVECSIKIYRSGFKNAE